MGFARRRARKIRRLHNVIFVIQHLVDLSSTINVVTECDCIDFRINNLLVELGSQSGTVSGVFTIGNYQVQIKLFAQVWYTMLYHAIAGATDDIANKQDSQVETFLTVGNQRVCIF